ncbi:hypothetical protein B0H14DRAFT_2611876 [Mycena olivaceomarginata]|nr:hypothetical protein B0H14DRAFT_2611876 [Mycena olivaceomarginata]
MAVADRFFPDEKKEREEELGQFGRGIGRPASDTEPKEDVRDKTERCTCLAVIALVPFPNWVFAPATTFAICCWFSFAREKKKFLISIPLFRKFWFANPVLLPVTAVPSSVPFRGDFNLPRDGTVTGRSCPLHSRRDDGRARDGHANQVVTIPHNCYTYGSEGLAPCNTQQHGHRSTVRISKRLNDHILITPFVLLPATNDYTAPSELVTLSESLLEVSFFGIHLQVLKWVGPSLLLSFHIDLNNDVVFVPIMDVNATEPASSSGIIATQGLLKGETNVDFCMLTSARSRAGAARRYLVTMVSSSCPWSI